LRRRFEELIWTCCTARESWPDDRRLRELLERGEARLRARRDRGDAPARKP
jgi:hypothetical protein